MVKIDIYSDENGVLINKFGIKDATQLKELESLIVSSRVMFLREQTFANCDFAMLCEIHKELFDPIYEWAGKIRTIDIAKSMLFCRAMFIREQANEIFSKLKKENYFLNADRNNFCEKAGQLFCDINMLHPFREGNGRTLREFMFHLGRNAGYKCDLNMVNRDIYLNASIKGHTDSADMIAIMKAIVHKIEPTRQNVEHSR